MFLKRYNGVFANRLRAGLIRAGYHSRPRFLIIGAQKAGTTALFYYLAEHPDIIPASEKEIGFFTPEVFKDWPEHPNRRFLYTPAGTHFGNPKTYHQAAVWYHNHFPLPHQLGRHRITFEATPEYLYYPSAAERIFQYNPQIKLIVLLREPLERAFSAWNMYRNFDQEGYRPLIYAPRRETRGFDEVVRDEINAIRCGKTTLGPDYVRRGLYFEQLLRYFKFFERNQILILDSCMLKHNTSAVVEQVINFLGLPEYRYQDEWHPFHMGKYKTQIPGATLRLLREFYKPHNEKLYQLLDHDFGWS